MKQLINLSEIRSENYDKNEACSCDPCLLCGKSVHSIEKRFQALCKEDSQKGLHRYSERTSKFFIQHYLHMDTDGNLYFANEDVAKGHESQGCFAVGCDCMKRYRQLRASRA